MGFWRLPGRPAAPGWGLGFFYLCVWPPPRLMRPILRPAPLLNPPWLPLGPLLNGKQWPWPPAGLPRPAPGPHTRGAGGNATLAMLKLVAGVASHFLLCCLALANFGPFGRLFWALATMRPRPASPGRAPPRVAGLRGLALPAWVAATAPPMLPGTTPAPNFVAAARLKKMKRTLALQALCSLFKPPWAHVPSL